MRNLFYLLFLALVLCLVCVPAHAEQAKKHEGRAAPFIRASSNPAPPRTRRILSDYTSLKIWTVSCSSRGEGALR